jgi:hypothetical protein
MNEYVMQQLERLQPLASQAAGEAFKIKITSYYGYTHYIDIPYDKYFRIAQILLED